MTDHDDRFTRRGRPAHQEPPAGTGPPSGDDAAPGKDPASKGSADNASPGTDRAAPHTGAYAPGTSAGDAAEAERQRLHVALRSGAEYRPTTDADWAAFQGRLVETEQLPTSVSGAESKARAGSSGPDIGGAEQPSRRWRMPLLAAAAVAVIALVTSIVVTGPFGSGSDSPGRDVASSGDAQAESGDSNSSGGPVFGSPESAGNGDRDSADGDRPSSGIDSGGVSVAPTTAVPPTSSNPAIVTIDTSKAGTAPSDVAMVFEGDGDDIPVLHVNFESTAPDVPSDGAITSDGSPLGYVTARPNPEELPASTDDGGGPFVYGAIGPEVMAVDITAVQQQRSANGEHSATGIEWTITRDDTAAASADLAGNMGDGWFAFAVQAPGSVFSEIRVVAYGARGDPIQARVFDTSDGSTTDLPVPSEQQRATHADQAARCAMSSGAGMGITDIGFNGASVELQLDRPDGADAADSTTGACLFDGRSWWYRPVSGGQLQAVGITGVGPFPSPVVDEPGTPGRFVWGVVGPGVSTVTAQVPGHEPISGRISRVGDGSDGATEARVFLIGVPVEGDVMVSVSNDDESRLSSTTLHTPTIDRSDSGNAPDMPYVATHPDVAAGDSALVRGSVFVIGNCVAVAAGAGMGTGAGDGSISVVTPVFPKGSIEPAQAPAVLHFNGNDYASGDAIELGGGSAGPESGSAQALPAHCPPAVFSVAG